MGIWDWHDEKVKKAIKNLFLENLCTSKDDRVLILSDTYKERIGELFFSVGTNFTSNISHLTYPPTGRHGIEPPEIVWKATFGFDFLKELKSKGLVEKVEKKEIAEEDEERVKELLLKTTEQTDLPSVVIAVNEHSISHTFFRNLCTNILSMRFASMPLFEPFMFYTSLQANWNLVERRSKAIAKLLTEAEEAHITCPLGTDVKLSLKGREGLADTGKLCNHGDFGNIPSGEAFTAPVEGTAEGVFVTKYAPTRKLKGPAKLFVKDGKVVDVKGENEFSKFLMNLFCHEKNADNIAELGIGTNEKAERFDNILEAEKILGTCHIAVGDNSSFGGKVRANVHIDLLIDKPTITLKNGMKAVKIMEDGKLLIGS